MNDIKACPFCGDPSTAIVYDSYSDIWRFSCPNCHLNASFGYGSASVHYGSKEAARIEALKLWNNRK